MLRKLIISTAIWMGATCGAHAEPERDVVDLRTMAEGCVNQGRDVCTVFASTQILTSLENLWYLQANDPDTIDWFLAAFEKASFRVSSEGNPSFRKFLAENALWTLDYFNERFASLTDETYDYENVRHFYAAYQLMRADACDQLNNAPCAESSLWHIQNARAKDYWPQIVERYEIDDEFAVALTERLLDEYKGRI